MVFANANDDGYKIIGINAKRMRGYMVRYIMENAPKDPEQLKEFSAQGYVFSSTHSTISNYVYLKSS